MKTDRFNMLRIEAILSLIWWVLLILINIAICYTLYKRIEAFGLESEKLVAEQKRFLLIYVMLATSMVVLYIITIPVHRSEKNKRNKIIIVLLLSLLISTITILLSVLLVAKAGILTTIVSILGETIINAILVIISHNIAIWIMMGLEDYKEGGLKKNDFN